MKSQIPLLVVLGLSMPVAFSQTQSMPAPPGQVIEPAAPRMTPQESGNESGSESDARDTRVPGAATRDAVPNDASTTSDTPTSGTSTMSGSQQSSPRDAEPDPMASVPPAGPVQTLTAKTENGVTYLCGGVGKDEAAYMKKSAREHDLMLTFATRRGDYLADVNVTIENARGEPILQTTCDAPIMLVDMPASGTYRIHAEAGGYRQDRTARINTNRRSVAAFTLTWPQSLAGTGAPSPDVSSTGASGTEGSSGSRQEPEEQNENGEPYREAPMPRE